MQNPTLIIMCGLQGSGKTTVGERIAEKMNAVILRSDTIRKQLFNPPIYSTQENDAVYAELLQRAQENLMRGKNIVLDATFSLQAGRRHAFDLAEKAGAKHFLVYCACEDESVAKHRLDSRGEESESDARWPQYIHAKKSFQIPDPEEAALYLDTSSQDAEGKFQKILATISS